ncbi:MAG: phage tail sheath subtilisin-like domain-containing protein [Rhodospirillales bacterium]|jgi:phage tail sheath gpL-like|nr:phage tail sheath subtilisin-like domain-containing protein [Rhodospirillales bacterium]
MPITFDQIPADFRTPGVYVEVTPSPAGRGVPGIPAEILLIAQKLPAGTLAALTPTPVYSTADAESFGGRGSMLHRMYRALRASNPMTRVWAIALADDAAGVAAAGTIVIGGAPTIAGSLHVWIAGARASVAVAVGQATTAIATALRDAVNALTDLPVTASATGSTVTLTARHKGLAGNGIDVRVSLNEEGVLPPGLTVAVNAMAGGATNPSIAAALAAMGDMWFTDIVMPYTDSANLALLTAELANRFGPLDPKDALAYAGARGTLAQLLALGSGQNSPHLVIIGANGSPTSPEEWAAALAGAAARAFQDDPARALRSLPLKGIMSPPPASRFTALERNHLYFDGISGFTVGQDGVVYLDRVITAYQTTALGVADDAYLDSFRPKQIAHVRHVYRTTLSRKFPRHKLASDGERTTPRGVTVTPRSMKAELVAIYGDLVDAAICEDMAGFKAEVICERSATDRNRMDVLLPVRFVGAVNTIAIQMQFSL